MDNHERSTLEQILNLLHGLIGRDDAKDDFRPDLSFVSDRPDSSGTETLIFPSRIFAEPENEKSPPKEGTKKGFLKFTTQEILKMPKKFREQLKLNGYWVTIRERVRGKTSCDYELRYRRNGYNISVSAKTKEKAKERFIEKTLALDPDTCTKSTIPTGFHDFSMYYFEKFRKRKVVKKTYDSDLARYKRYIRPKFGNIPIQTVLPLACQELVDEITEMKLGKTADEILSLLNQTFKMAIKHGLIKNNPMDIVFHIQHERVHGAALTIEEERKLLQATAGTPYQLMFAIALYTGVRPYEYKSVKLVGNMIIAQNCKRKNAAQGKIEWKRIPVSPMLAPYLDGSAIRFYIPEVVRDKFKSILPNHTLKDMRTTFYTRCKTCGVALEALKEFMGHTGNGLDRAYTDLPDEFLIAEAQKIKY